MPVGREIPGIVVHHAVCRRDFLSADFADLGIGCGAMQAGGNQDRDVFPRDARLLQPAQHGGSVRRFGAGRVMSQTEIAALRLPRASSANGGTPIGRSSADSRAPCQSGSGFAVRASRTR